MAGLASWALTLSKRTFVWRGLEFGLTREGRIVPRKIAEDAQSPNMAQVSLNSDEGPVSLSPPDRDRGALRTAPQEIAADLVVLLRRRFQS